MVTPLKKVCCGKIWVCGRSSIPTLQRASNFAAFGPFSNLASRNKMGKEDLTGFDAVCRQYLKQMSACWFIFMSTDMMEINLLINLCDATRATHWEIGEE